MANNQVEMVHQDTTFKFVTEVVQLPYYKTTSVNWKNLHPSPIYTLSFLSIPKLYYLTIGSCGPYCIGLHDVLCSVGLHLKRLVCRDTPPIPKHGLCNSDKHDENWKSKPCKPVRPNILEDYDTNSFELPVLISNIGRLVSAERGKGANKQLCSRDLLFPKYSLNSKIILLEHDQTWLLSPHTSSKSPSSILSSSKRLGRKNFEKDFEPDKTANGLQWWFVLLQSERSSSAYLSS